MSYHAHTSLLVHYVFSTKHRLPVIPVAMQPRLWAYVGGIARTNNMKALAVGGTPDHLHVLLSLPPNVTISTAIQLVKAGSSKVDARAAKNQIRMASWLWGLHHWDLTNQANGRLHPQPGEASRQKELCPGMEDVLEAPRAGRLPRLNSAVPDGTCVRFFR